MTQLMLDYRGTEVPPHTAEAIENYLFRGFHPGGFVSAVLCNDLLGSVTSADHINRECIESIIKWVAWALPSNSWGNRAVMQDWIDDVDGMRTQYATAVEKRFMWDKLSQT